MRRVPRAAARALVLALSLPLASCLIDSSSTTNVDGRYVSDETLSRIEPGRSKDFVLALLGPASEIVDAEQEGSEIWRYSYRRETRRSGGFIFLFSTSKRVESSGTVYVEFKDGKVVESWRD
ncbi:MAG: outer membrane protein assembly factor BamE [Planctomycetota bacterium]